MNLFSKKVMITALVCICSLAILSAQPYARISFGYGFPIGQTADGSDIEVSSSGDLTEKVNTYSLGGGLPIGIAGGYMFNENIGAELGFSYLLGSTIETSRVSSPTSSVLVETYTRQLRLNPSIFFTSTNEQINVYGRVGLVLPLLGTTFSEGSITNTADQDLDGMPDNYTETFKIENKGKLSLGYSAATGLSFSVNESIDIFGEAELISLAVRKHTQEYTEYNEVLTLTTGSSTTVTLGDRDVIDNKTEFETELVNGGNTTDVTQPAQELTSFTPFNKIGLNIGVKYTFGN